MQHFKRPAGCWRSWGAENDQILKGLVFVCCLFCLFKVQIDVVCTVKICCGDFSMRCLEGVGVAAALGCWVGFAALAEPPLMWRLCAFQPKCINAGCWSSLPVLTTNTTCTLSAPPTMNAAMLQQCCVRAHHSTPRPPQK